MQQLNPSEISEIIKQRIDKLDVSAQAQNEGTIVSVSDGIIRIHGLADVMYGEMIEFEGGLHGMALNLERDSLVLLYWVITKVWQRVKPAVAPNVFLKCQSGLNWKVAWLMH